MIEHTRALAAATELPVSVDLENGYGPTPRPPRGRSTRAAEAGAAGGSIEDYDPDGGLYEFDEAVERVTAACEAAARLDFPFTLTARAENHIRGNPDLDDTIARLQAFERGGGRRPLRAGTRERRRDPRRVRGHLEARQRAGAAAPVARRDRRGGRQRISVGGALTWVAIAAMAAAAQAMRDDGDFSALAAKVPLADWLG